MKIYSISGFCPDIETGTAHIVHELHASHEDAQLAFNDLIEITREHASIVEGVKGIGNCKGVWMETNEETHGNDYSIKTYSCSVSVDLKDDKALNIFRKMSPLGLIKNESPIDIMYGISVTPLYVILPFKIASLQLSAKEL